MMYDGICCLLLIINPIPNQNYRERGFLKWIQSGDPPDSLYPLLKIFHLLHLLIPYLFSSIHLYHNCKLYIHVLGHI